MIKLNENQLKAVETNNKKVLVMAGAGAGKTRVLTTRIKYLLDKGISAFHITAFTFTNKAANEMKARLSDYNFSNVYTFHSYCYEYIRCYYLEFGFTKQPNVIDDEDKAKILRIILDKRNIDINPKFFIECISKIKNNAELSFAKTEEAMIINRVYFDYQAFLKQYNYIDFDDMVLLLVNKIDELEEKDIIYEGCKYILVDECQDTNQIQLDLINKLSEKHQNIFMVGDEDQLIYSFRNSNISILREFKEKCDEVIILNENYRCSQNILKLANNLINHNKNRTKKNLFSNITSKYEVKLREFQSTIEEAKSVAVLIKILKERNINYEEVAILYRNNNQSFLLEKELMEQSIPFTVYGNKPFYMYQGVKRVIAIYRFLDNKDDEIALRNILCLDYYLIEEFFNNYHKQSDSLIDFMLDYQNDYIGKMAHFLLELDDKKYCLNKEDFFMKIVDYLSIKDKQEYERIMALKDIILASEDTNVNSILNGLFLDRNEQKTRGVNLLTIHKAKGLEFRCVIIISCNEGILPKYCRTIQELEEERRLMYVAMTRAKEILYITNSVERYEYGNSKECMPSSFFCEILNKML